MSINSKIVIPAEAHSDDHVIEVEFDSEAWFESASDDEIRALAGIDWGGDYEADQIALTLSEYDEDLKSLFDYLYLRNNREHAHPKIGYEVHVREAAALDWLSTKKPVLYAELARKVAA